MSLINYEPVSFLNQMQDDLNDFFKLNGNRLVPSLFSEPSSLISSQWMPRVNIKENDRQFVITADVPGVNPKDIQISMENGYLSISGERKTEKEESDDNHRLKECSYGSFERRFRLPATADADNITAMDKNGVLTITIAKKEAKKARLVEIKT